MGQLTVKVIRVLEGMGYESAGSGWLNNPTKMIDIDLQDLKSFLYKRGREDIPRLLLMTKEGIGTFGTRAWWKALEPALLKILEEEVTDA